MVHGFELSLPPSPAWADLARDLVATAASPLDLGIDRFQDLLVLTEQVCLQGLARPGTEAVEVGLALDADGLNLTCESAEGPLPPDVVTEMAMSVLADEHWHEITGTGSLVGFRFRG